MNFQENSIVIDQVIESEDFSRLPLRKQITLITSLSPDEKEQEIQVLLNNSAALKTLLNYSQRKISEINGEIYILSSNNTVSRANGINLAYGESLYTLIDPLSDNLTRTFLNEISEVIAQKINMFAVYRKSFQTYSIAIDQLVSLNEDVTADSLNKIASSYERSYRRFEEFPDEESTLAAIQTMIEVKPYTDFNSIGVELYPEQLTNGRYAIRAK